MVNPAAFAPPGLELPPVADLPEPITPGPSGWRAYFAQHHDLYMAPQVYDWTCSVAATTWVLQATGLEPGASREATAYEIGYPQCVNAAVGLEDTNCVVRVFQRRGVSCHTVWPSFDQMYALAQHTTGLLNSTRWYHFVAIRGVSSGGIWVANSALGYKGIFELVTRGQWEAWASSWKAVVLD